MGKLISIVFFIAQALWSGDYPLKNGKPTSGGIELYVEQNWNSLVQEYQAYVGDTIYNVWFYTSDQEQPGSTEPMELGWFFPHEIYISTEELFQAYELDDLSPKQREKLGESNRFVRGVMIHELTHEYVSQIGVEMKSVHHLHVDKSYETNILIVSSYETFGSSFIEEGLSEYMTEKMGQLIPPVQIYIPASLEDLLDRKHLYQVRYKYASAYLETFLDNTGFKEGVQILLHNPPPSYEEILHPGLFFDRLVVPDIPVAISTY